RPPPLPLSPYTTLFRSAPEAAAATDAARALEDLVIGEHAQAGRRPVRGARQREPALERPHHHLGAGREHAAAVPEDLLEALRLRSEEHTSELQSRENLV